MGVSRQLTRLHLEQLRATFDGLQLIIIGDMHDLPLLDLKAGKFTAKAKDWSTDVRTLAPLAEDAR